jgi:hypothetical protein
MFGSNRFHRLLTAFALTALVAGFGSPAHARPAARPGGGTADVAGTADTVRADAWNPLSSLWSLVSRLWSGGIAGQAAAHAGAAAGSGLQHLTGAEGASLDPHGGTTTSSGDGTGSSTPQGPGGGSL